jgi:hypothetical protein
MFLSALRVTCELSKTAFGENPELLTLREKCEVNVRKPSVGLFADKQHCSKAKTQGRRACLTEQQYLLLYYRDASSSSIISWELPRMKGMN